MYRRTPDPDHYYIGVSAGGLWGTLTSASDMAFYRVGIRPATAAEIRDQTVLAPMEATVSENSGALAALNGRTTAYWQVEANAGSGAEAFMSARADTSTPTAAPITWITDNYTYANGRTVGANAFSGWAAGAASKEAYTNGAFCSAQVANPATQAMFGLTTYGKDPDSYTNLDFAWFWNATNTWYIYELGTNITNVPALATDVPSIEFNGSQVIYKLNGRVVRTVTPPNVTFRLGLSIYNAGDAFKNVVFGSAAPSTSSSIGLGASEIALYNPTGDNTGEWKKAVSVVDGDVLIQGGLKAGAYIKLGNGEGWPVALKPRNFSISDGEVVSFGTTLDGLPNLLWQKDHLAPLNSGETYSLYAENLTTTGFTARVKISVPATPANYDLTTATSPGTGPTFQIDKSGYSDATDGTYTVKGNGSATVYSPEPGGPSGGLAYVGVWAKYSSGWVKVTSIACPIDWQSSSGQLWTGYWFLSETVQLGSGVLAVGLTLDSVTSGNGTVNAFTHLIWQAAGTGSSIRSATPNGEKTTVTVSP